ncbi:MAG: AAA family ATPase [Solirubrobacteraceae bacterium]
MSPSGRRVSSPAFAGRSEQLAALATALDRADGGEAGAVFVGGEAGVGKTRLVAEFERLARSRGACVLAVVVLTWAAPSFPTRRCLGRFGRWCETPSPERWSSWSGAGGGELGRVLPGLRVGGSGEVGTNEPPLVVPGRRMMSAGNR